MGEKVTSWCGSQKQNPILTQIKASLQVTYYLDQSNTVTYPFISNILAADAASLGDNTPRGYGQVNTLGNKLPESGVKGEGGAIFTGFYPNWYKLSNRSKQSIFGGRERINIKGGGKRKSFYKTHGPAQYFPFGLIIWYIAKIIPTLLE